MPISTCQSWLCLTKSSLGVLFGFSAFVTFFFWYSNFEAGIWGFCSGVIAALCLHIFYLDRRGQLGSWHSRETLTGLQHLGFTVTILSIAYFIWYLFVAIYYHEGVTSPVSINPYCKGVWAYITAVYGFLLFMASKMYSQEVDSAPLLLDV